MIPEYDPAIPRHELLLLSGIIRDAENDAARGAVMDGYERLDLGLLYAETPAIDPRTGDADPPDPWAEALILLYQRALVAYASRHGMAWADDAVMPRLVGGSSVLRHWLSDEDERTLEIRPEEVEDRGVRCLHLASYALIGSQHSGTERRGS